MTKEHCHRQPKHFKTEKCALESLVKMKKYVNMIENKKKYEREDKHLKNLKKLWIGKCWKYRRNRGGCARKEGYEKRIRVGSIRKMRKK